MHDIDDYRGSDAGARLLVYRYDAPLFFANAENFVARALKSVDENPDPVEWFILNAEANSEMDLTAIDALCRPASGSSLRGHLLRDGAGQERNADCAQSRRPARRDRPGEHLPTLPTAVEAYRDR